MQLFIILGLVIAVLAATFAWQNPGIVAVRFISWKFEGSIALICVVVFAMGFLSNFFLSIASVIRYRWNIYKQNKKIQDLEDELADKEKRPIIDIH
jgi:uncharacterized integral membrane protein